MKHRILKKLSSRAGESIGETLVATLIAALALLMLAGAVSAGMRIVTRSKTAMDKYYADNNALASQDKGSDIYHSDGLTLTVSGLNPAKEDYAVDYWANEQVSGKPVIAYAPTPSPEP